MNAGAKKYWDSVAAKWKETKPQKLWRKHSDEVYVRFLSRVLKKGRIERILKTDMFDEAFGEGLYPILKKHAQKVYGIDISYVTLSAARARYHSIQTMNADVRCLPLSDRMFDLVVSSSTLDHFQTKDEIINGLKEIERIIRSGGELILILDNPHNPILLIRNFLSSLLLKRMKILPYYVGVTCRLSQLQKFIEKLGFKVVHTGTILHCPRIIAVILASILERYFSSKFQNYFLNLLIKFEQLAYFPIKNITGYYITLKAVKVPEVNK